MEEVETDVIGANLMREDMYKLWLTKDLIGQDEREILVWQHRLNLCSFKYLLRLYRRIITPKNLSQVKKLTPYLNFLFGRYHRRPWRTKSKCLSRSIIKPSETRPGSMTSIDQMVSSQPRFTPQVTVSLTHARFWEANIFVYHYSD